jgi:hypothetical protein
MVRLVSRIPITAGHNPQGSPLTMINMITNATGRQRSQNFARGVARGPQNRERQRIFEDACWNQSQQRSESLNTSSDFIFTKPIHIKKVPSTSPEGFNGFNNDILTRFLQTLRKNNTSNDIFVLCHDLS